MTELHVVLGAGQVGPGLAERLVATGKRVRVVRRSAAGEVAGVERLQADLGVPGEAARACQGADVIYDCTNPARYSSWDQTLRPLKTGILDAARETGAFLVSLDNLYMYAPPDGEELTEDSPMAPSSHKGALRKELAEALFAASERGEVRMTVGRASDFFGPGSSIRSLLGSPTVRQIARGWGAFAPGDPDLPRSYSYVPDVIQGLFTLGANPEQSEGRVFHLPVAHRTGTTRELIAGFASELGVSARTFAIPRWAFRAGGWFSADLREVTEMLYQWEAPFVLSDARFVETFGVRATPIEHAIRAAVAAAKPPPRLAAAAV